MNIKKTLTYILATSILALTPVKTNAQNTYSLKIESSDELKKEIANDIINLATDIDDDGKPDKEGYEILFKKLEKEYNKDQSTEEFQKQMQDYVSGIKNDNQLSILYENACSMFTEKDISVYLDKMFEVYLPKMLEEAAPKIEEQLDRIIKSK